jgi:hypothetical protein
MNGYHNIYLQWRVTIALTYNERLPWHRPLMNGHRNNDLQWTVTITSTYNGRYP